MSMITSMLRIRLQRRGKRGYATYRVVVADGIVSIKGKFIEDFDSFNPHTAVFSVDAEAVKTWMSKGVQPSDTVYNLLITNKIISGEKRALFTPKPKQAEAVPAN